MPFIPGNSLPSRYSKNAPPAVETKLKSSKNFNIVYYGATVSPPPATEKIFLPLFFLQFDFQFQNFLLKIDIFKISSWTIPKYCFELLFY